MNILLSNSMLKCLFISKVRERREVIRNRRLDYASLEKRQLKRRIAMCSVQEGNGIHCMYIYH